MAGEYNITRILVKKENNEDRQYITPYEGEFLYIIDTKKLYIGDGETPGGVPVIPDQDIIIDMSIGDGLYSPGFTVDNTPIIALGLPTTLDGHSENKTTLTSHSHEVNATDSRDVSNTHQLLLAKALRDHIINEPHGDNIDPGIIDHNLLLNYNINEHINHHMININTGNGLEGGGDITQSRTIHMRPPQTINGITDNNADNTGHTHNLDVTDQRNVTNTSQILLAKALYDHIQNEPHNEQTDGTDHNHDHNLLLNVVANQHIDHTTIQIQAGNGLTGGGNITNSQILNLGIPSTLHGETQNQTTLNSHTHDILVTASRNIISTDNQTILLARALYDHILEEPHSSIDNINPSNIDHNLLYNYDINHHIDHTNINIISGLGLIGGGDISQTRTISLGTPSTITGITSNTRTDTSHCHEIKVSDEMNITDFETLLLAKALKTHIDVGHSELPAQIIIHDQLINVAEFYEYSINAINRCVDVYVLDEQIGSPTQNMWINGNSVCTIAKTNTFIRIYNEHTSNLRFNIIIS